MPAGNSDTVAAVDLGSNSFHMLVARPVDGEVHVVDKLKERVALAAGLDDRRRLTEEAMERALTCLERFGQRVRHMPARSVRVVGTNTLRQAKNRREFLVQAERVLGHPVEVISGQEEARLIYVGVSHTSPALAGRRLVVDIGGGSTECVIGEGFEPQVMDSLYMGHVAFMNRFFPKGEIQDAFVQAAELAAKLELQTIDARYREIGWTRAVGSSGTILAVETILRENGWSEGPITAGGLARLRSEILGAAHVDDLYLDGLKGDRRTTLPAGVAILSALFERFDLEEMVTSDSALREGLVYDLLGRFRDEDVRERTVEQLMERHHVDREQAARVERTAAFLLDQAAVPWDLGSERDRRVLSWAARLHEVGLSVSHSGYHKHGHYILANSDMAGFSKDDQQEAAVLTLNHRRKLRASRFDELPRSRADADFRLCLLLRLAVRLNRSRSAEAVPPVKLGVDAKRLRLTFPAGWLAANPLTWADLEQEHARLRAAGKWSLEVRDAGGD